MKINIEETPIFENYVEKMKERGMKWNRENCSITLTEFIMTIKDFLNKEILPNKHNLLFTDQYYVKELDEKRNENIMIAYINKDNDLQLLFNLSKFHECLHLYTTHNPIYHDTCNSAKRKMRYVKDEYISPMQCIMFKCIRDYVQSDEINESDAIIIPEFCEMVCIKDVNGNKSIVIHDIA